MYALTRFLSAIEDVLGTNVAECTAAVSLCQFHLLFYMSRPLPNVFALFLGLICSLPLAFITPIVFWWSTVLFALRHWVLAKTSAFVWTSTAAIILFRSELCLFLGLLLLSDLLLERLTFRNLIKHGVPAGLICLGECKF